MQASLDKTTVSQNLRRLLDERGWTPYELARAMGCQRRANTVYRIVRGDNCPSLKTLDRFARALGVAVENFLTDQKNPRNEG